MSRSPQQASPRTVEVRCGAQALAEGARLFGLAAADPLDPADYWETPDIIRDALARLADAFAEAAPRSHARRVIKSAQVWAAEALEADSLEPGGEGWQAASNAMRWHARELDVLAGGPPPKRVGRPPANGMAAVSNAARQRDYERRQREARSALAAALLTVVDAVPEARTFFAALYGRNGDVRRGVEASASDPVRGRLLAVLDGQPAVRNRQQPGQREISE